jgi:hypothetical protein
MVSIRMTVSTGTPQLGLPLTALVFTPLEQVQDRVIGYSALQPER